MPPGRPWLMQDREVTLELEKQTGQRVSITGNIVKLLVINTKNLAEIAQKRLALKDVGIVVELGISILFLVVLVVDFTHDLFEDVLQRHQSARASKLIDNDGDMHLVTLELPEQVINLLGLGHEIRRTYQALPSEVLWLRQIRQQIFDIKHTTDIILIILIDGNTTVAVVNNEFQHIFIRAANINVSNILAGRHHLFSGLVAKTDNALEHALFVLDVVLIGQFKSLLQIVNAQLA